MVVVTFVVVLLVEAEVTFAVVVTFEVIIEEMQHDIVDLLRVLLVQIDYLEDVQVEDLDAEMNVVIQNVVLDEVD